ncbi:MULTISPECIES: hypothetical protein [Shewanella]|uniref:hypothetical protein n=1 Tax=Shewanella TaxID=22 RepID=UPI001BC81EA8|nr:MULTISPECIES: hypothetical protein [Shewanella]GIU50365.1 hypothetical protein TUM4249_10550 [Shewanella sp. KT0246]
MKYLGFFTLVLLLALGSLFVGLQIGKTIDISDITQAKTEQSLSLAEHEPSAFTQQPSALKHESAQLVAELKKEVQQLKQQLAEKNSLIDAMNSSMGLLEQQVEIAYTEIDEAIEQTNNSPFHPEPSSITAEQAKQWVPQAFANMLANQQGDMVDLFKRHHQDEINHDWAVNREQALRDAIDISESSSGVDIESINCKTTTCEIRGMELSPNAWMQVSQQIQGGNLGKNVSTWSYLASDDNGDTLIYMLSEVDEANAQ